MSNYIINLVVYRAVLPVLLVLCCIVKPVLLTFPYFILLLYLPFIPIQYQGLTKGSTKKYWIGLFVVSIVILLNQIVLKILLFVNLMPIKFMNQLQYYGFVKLNNISASFETLLQNPEIIIIILSAVMFIFLKYKETSGSLKRDRHTSHHKNKISKFISSPNFAKFMSLLSLLAIGIIQPSLPSFVYYFIFIGSTIWWGYRKELEKNYVTALKVTLDVLIIHITILFLYQNQWIQSLIEQTPINQGAIINIYKFAGLIKFFLPTCVESKIYQTANNMSSLEVNCINYNSTNALNLILNQDIKYDQYLNLLFLILGYFTIGISLQNISKNRTNLPKRSESQLENFKVSGIFKRVVRKKTQNLEQDANRLDEIVKLIQYLWNILYQNSYVLCNITMMAWSIIFHSVTGLIMLLWTNIILILPNPRKNMMHSSPFLVFFTVFILIASYLLELFKILDSDKISIIFGFTEKYHPYEPLLLKTTFTIIFMILLRKYNHPEQKEQVASESESPILESIKCWAHEKFVSLWILVVLLNILFLGLSGEKITVFKMFYMILFLVFVLTFIISFNIWKKFLYSFMLLIVICSILNLVLIYTYQFEDISSNINFTLNGTDVWQEYIGLELYKKKDLSVKLFKLTIMVLVAAIQLRYCHKEFITLVLTPNSDAEQQAGQRTVGPRSEVKTDSYCMKILKNIINTSSDIKELIYKILEVHSNKILLLSLYVLMTTTVNIVNIFLIFLAVIGIVSTENIQRKICKFCALLCAVLPILLMVDLLTKFSVTTLHIFEGNGNQTANETVVPYLKYLFLFLILSIINLRKIRSPVIREFVFENITREDAEKDTKQMFKYFMNYGFYRFGYEISLMMLVITITYHKDVVACFYGICFLVLYFCLQRHLRTLWNIVIFLVMLMIMLQYSFYIGKFLKIDTHFNLTSYIEKVSFGSELPEKENILYLSIRPLITDFLLLLLMCRQSLVFKSEANYEKSSQTFVGGSNKRINNCIRRNSFSNPTHDFTFEYRNYLDVMKMVLFNGFYFLSLGTVILAGSANVSIFSFGYIIGSFVYLWKGIDFYLLPTDKIQRDWNFLVGYNVLVIVAKVFLHLNGYYNCFSKVFGLTCYKSEWHNSEIFWDGIAFGFLMIQRRIFRSYYFCHIIKDRLIRSKFATRGSELLAELEIKERFRKEKLDEQMLSNIEAKIKKIREMKLQNIRYVEPKDHDTAISSGDHYMFYESDEETEEISYQNTDDYTEDETSRIRRRLKSKKSLGSFVKDIKKLKERSVFAKAKLKSLNSKFSRESLDEEEVKKIQEDETSMNKKLKSELLKMVKTFVNSLLVTITKHIYNLSKKERYVMRKLASEREIYKNSGNFERDLIDQSQDTILLDSFTNTGFSLSEDELQEEKIHSSEANEDNQSDVDDKVFGNKIPIILEFFNSIWYLLISHTATICYILIFVNQLYSASILSLPLPIMVLLWGTLILPRPSQTFWTTLIVYTELMITIKIIFHFEFWPWTDDVILDSEPLAWIRILGIEKKSGSFMLDVIMLLSLFMHRKFLKLVGLWNTIDIDEEFIQNSKNNLDLTDDENINATENEENFEYQEESGFKKIVDNLVQYFKNISDAKLTSPDDVYTLMFLCDFINFFVIIFGFSAFGTREGDGGVLSYVENNTVPGLFLSMLLIQFALIVLDRGLYLKKFYIGKVVLHYFSAIGLHVWIFFLLPASTDRSCYSTWPPIIFYIIKCFYLLISAYQIRCGYPLRILINFLTTKFNMVNQLLFNAYWTIPFLMEFRCLMDWMWTDTSLTFFEWLKMENIFASIYEVKCGQEQEDLVPTPAGQKYKNRKKYIIGGSLLILIICVIWLPLLLFALGSIVGKSNIPYDITVSLRIGSYKPFYQMTALENNIISMKTKWDSFVEPYAKNKPAKTFLSNYDPEDVVAVHLRTNSYSKWSISPPDKKELLEDLRSDSEIICQFRYTVLRRSNAAEIPSQITEDVTYKLTVKDTFRVTLADIIANKIDNTSVVIPKIMPKFLAVRNRGALTIVDQLQKNGPHNLILNLHVSENNKTWWETKENCEDSEFKNLANNNCSSYLTMYLFNDKIFPESINLIAGGGIIGLYTTFIFLIGNYLRQTLFSSSKNDIMFEDLPFVDRIWQLCLDIYLVRESKFFSLEEYLYAKLIFLYRSPEIMIKWTKPREEKELQEIEESSEGSI